ncbi:hypothetical protein HYU09_05315 [Candidatus Woesearchaeota archaeon]|nr:hypothetical protein [Candidatus Woesearchaeota archaeon]
MEGIAPTIDVPPEEADSLKAAIREAIDYAVANFEPHRLNQSGPSTRQLAELMHVYAETLSNRTRRRAIYSTVGHLGAVAGYGYASIKIL